MKGHFVTHGGSGLFRGGVRRIGLPLRGLGGGGGKPRGGGLKYEIPGCVVGV